MLFKKVISTVIAIDCALGCITCGVKKAEERTLEKMSAYIDEVDDYEPVKVSRKDPYVRKNLGTFSLTFYVPDKQWGYQTSTGTKSVHKKTCAVDPNVIPLGSRIRITGNNGEVLELLCCDIGGGIKGNKIDIFYDSKNYGGVQAGYDWIARFGTIHSVYLLEE